jgi:outer membrane biosynthesis protein TonB
VIQKENAESERQSEIEMARQAQLENNSKKSPLDLAILRQRLARLEEVQRAKRERAQNENTRADLDVRPQEQAVSFVAGLNTGDKVSVNLKRNVPNQKTKKLDEVEEAKDAVFVGRKENGNVILNVGTFNPDQTSLVGTSERMEFAPAEFSKIGMMSPPKYLKLTPVEEAIRSLVGDNPTIEDLEAKLGAPYTGKNGAQFITIKDGLSSDPIPVEVKWFNKRGEKGAIIPKATGKFTNSPLMTVRQMNQGLSVEVSDQQMLAGINREIQVEKRGGKNVVTAVNLWGKTYRRGKTAQDFSVNQMILSEGTEGESRRDSDQRRRDAGAEPIVDTDPFGRPIEPKKTFEARGLFSFDPIWRNSPERIAASKAQTAKEDAALFAMADSDFSEALSAANDKEARKKLEINNPAMLEVALRVRGLLDRVDKLNEVDRKFLENEYERGVAFINKSRFDDDTKGLAIVALRQRIIEDFAERAGKKKAETRVGSSQYTDLFLNELNEIRKQRIKGSDKTALAKAEKLRQSPEKLSDEELEAGELSSERAKKIFTRETNRSQKGVEADIDAAVERSMEKLRRKKAFNWLMTEKETEELLKLRDREAAEVADRKKKGRPPKKRQAYNRMPEDDARAEIQSIADRYKELGGYKGKGVADKIFNPIAAAQGAALNAARAIRRREQSDFVDLVPDFFEDTTDFSDANPQRESEPVEKAFDAPQRKEVAQGAADAPTAPVSKGETPIDKKIKSGLVATTPQEKLEVVFKINEDLTPEDREIALAAVMGKTDESGRKIKGQKSGLTTEEKARSKVIKKYLNNEISYEQLYPNTGRRTGRPSDSGGSNVRRDPQGGAEPIQSRGRRSQGADADGRPGRVDGGAAATTGDIPTSEAETSGGRPVRPPLDPQAARSVSRVAQRIFVQSFGRLSDEEMSQLSPAEIEAAYSAILSKTDSAAALEGRNAIAETAGSMADLAGKTGQELLEGFSVEYRQAQNDAAKAANIRANLGRLLKARAFAGTTPFLEALAKDRNNTESQRIRARELLKLIRRGVNLDNLAVQVGNYFNDKNEDVSWAGVLGQSSDGDVSVVINLAQRHDRDDAAETYLHELGHVAGMAKASRSIKLTAAEEAALNRLEDLRGQAVLKAAERLGIQPTEGVPPDIQKLAQAVYAEAESKELSNNRTYGGLLDIREFVVETTNNPEFAALLADLGFGAPAPGQKTSLLGAVRQAWDAAVNLMSGIKADVNSPLAMAFKDSWLINFANMGAELTALSDYTLPRVRRSKLRDEMYNMQRAANFVESEIETRNLAGTTEERAALLKEYKKANKRKAKPTTAEPQPQAAPSGFSTQGFNAGIATEPNFGEASRRLATRPTEAGAVESVFQTPRAPRAGEGVVNIGANPEPIIFPPPAAAPAESQEEPVAQKSVFQDVVTGATEGEGFRVGPVMEVRPFRTDVQEDPVELPPREPKKEEKRAPEKIEADLKAWAVRLLAGGKDTTAFEKAIAFNESRIANKELSAEERSSAAKYLAILLDAFEAENLQRDVRQIPRLERKEVPADVIAPVKAEEPKKEAPKKEEPKKEEPPDEEPPKPPKPPKKPKIVPPAVTPATQKQSKSKKTERAAKAVEPEKSPQVSDKTSPQKAAAPSEKQGKISDKNNDGIPTSEELIALNQQVIAARPKGSTFGFAPGFDFTNLTPERARGLRDNLQEALRRIPNYQAPKDEPIMSRAARREVSEEVAAINTLPDDATIDQIELTAPLTIGNLKSASQNIAGSFSEFSKILSNSFKSLVRFAETLWKKYERLIKAFNIVTIGSIVGIGPMVAVEYQALSGPKGRADLRATGLTERSNIFKPYIKNASVEQLDQSLQTPEETINLIRDAVNQSVPYAGNIDFDFNSLIEFANQIDINNFPSGAKKESSNYSSLIEITRDDVKSAAEFLKSSASNTQQIESKLREIMGAMEFFTKKKFNDVKFKLRNTGPEEGAIFVALARAGGNISSRSTYYNIENTIEIQPQSLIAILDNSVSATSAARHIANELVHNLQYQTNNGDPIGLLSIKLSDFDTAATLMWMKEPHYSKRGSAYQIRNAESNWGDILVSKYFNEKNNIQLKSFSEIINEQPKIKETLEKKETQDFIDKIYAYQIGAKEVISKSSEPIMSRAARRVVRPVTKKTGGGKTYEVGGIFARDEVLDARAGDLNINRKANVRADISRVEDLSRILRQQISKIYNGKTVPFGDLNTALGNLENPLTNDQLDRIDAALEAQGETAADDLKKQFLRENRENFKKIKQPQALAKLPKEIATTIREMSGHVESLSRQLLNQKVVWDDLAITVDEALGIYLNRSYAIFDDPNWADRVKKNEGVIGAARRFIKNSLVTQEAQRLIAEGIAAGAPISQFDARAKAAKSILPSEVEEVLEGYLSIGESRPDTSVLSGRILGQKNLSILNKRGVIAPEIQALWGRYEDPSVNYAKTIAKLSALVNNDKFLNEIIDLGRAENWIWDPKNPQNKTAGPPRGYVKFESGENRSLQPLGGLYMIPELARGLRETDLSGNPEEMAAWYQAFTKLTAYSMAMKTVGSAAGQVRNALGQFFIMVASGNLSIGDIASGRFKNNLKFAARSVLAKNWGRYGKSMTRDKWRAEIEDMIRRGVLGESVSMGLLDELMQTSRAHGSPDFQDTIFEKFLSPAKWTWDFAKRSYAAGEEWAKVVIYLSEQQKYREAFPKWSDEQIKDRAARNAKNVHWTYSNAPQIVQDIKKFPFIAPFVTFTSEVIRTTAQTIKLAREEISEGRRTGNEELERIGWQRVRGMMLVATVPTLVGSGAMALAGIDGDDEEALRKFLPDWQKNNQLIMFRRESGEVSFVDVSFLDYSQYFKKPIVALYRSFKNSDNASEILTDGAVQMALEALGPFTGEQIFSGAIADAMRNTDASGRQVYNPQDTPERIGVAVAKKIFWDPFIPGTAASGSRILSAATGQVSESGRAYELANELGSVLLGQRISSLDAQQSLAFAANTFSRQMRDATMLFNREFNARGSRTPADITSGYLRANAARKRLSEWLRERQQAAVTLGLTRKETESILKANNLSNDVVKSIMTGIYPKYKASDEAVSEADPARVSAYRAIFNDTEDTEILP